MSTPDVNLFCCPFAIAIMVPGGAEGANIPPENDRGFTKDITQSKLETNFKQSSIRIQAPHMNATYVV